MFCEKPPEKPVCRCKNCVLRQPDIVPWIDVLSLSMAEKNDGVFRRVSNKTNRSMESVITDPPDTKKTGGQKTPDQPQQQEYNTPTGVNTPLESYPQQDTRPPTPPSPPQPTIVLIVVNKSEQPSSSRRCDPGCPGSEPPTSAGRCDPGCPGSGPPTSAGRCDPGCPGSGPPTSAGRCDPGCPGSAPPPSAGRCDPGCPGSEPPMSARGCVPGCPGSEPPPLHRRCYQGYPGLEHFQEPRGYPGPRPEYLGPEPRGFSGPGPEYPYPEPRGYSGPGPEYPYPDPRIYLQPGSPRPEYPYPEPRRYPQEYPCPEPRRYPQEYPCPEPRRYKHHGPECSGPRPGYPCPEPRDYSCPRPGYSCPVPRRPCCPGPGYPYPAASGSPSPKTRRYSASCGSPNRRYSESPGPGRRSGYDERYRCDGNRCSRNRHPESPRRQSRGYSNNGNADSSRNRGSPTCQRNRCAKPKLARRIKSESTFESTESIKRENKSEKMDADERNKSDYTFESAESKPVDNRLGQNKSDYSIQSVISKTTYSLSGEIKPDGRLAGSGNYKTTKCKTSENKQETSKYFVCKGSGRSNISIKSQTQLDKPNYWECDSMEVVVTDDTNKTFKCIQVPICISVGKPTNCGCKDGNCTNFDSYSLVGETCDEDEDKCSCTSQEKRSCSSNEKCSCSSEGTGSFVCPATGSFVCPGSDSFVCPASDPFVCPVKDMNNSQGKDSTNSNSVCSCETQSKCSSESQSKCSCYSVEKCSLSSQDVPNITPIPEVKEPEEPVQLACNLSNLEDTLRGLVPNVDCMCFLKKKNRSRRRRKKKSPKVYCDRFGHPPYIFYPKPKCLDYGISPYRKMCFNPCCCDQLGMSTYYWDYCTRGRHGGY